MGSSLESQKITARSISSNRDIQFRLDSNADSFEADLDENLIVIPFSEKMFREAENRRIRAGIDHETAHVKYSSPIKVEDQTVNFIFQGIEDGRVNKLISDEYQGCKDNLLYFFDDVTQQFKNEVNKKEKDEYKIDKITTYLYERIWLGTSSLELREKYNMKNEWINKIEECMKSNRLQSSSDSLKLAKDICNNFNFDEDKSTGSGNDDDDQEDTEDSEDSNENGENEEKSDEEGEKEKKESSNKESRNENDDKEQQQITSINKMEEDILEREIDSVKKQIVNDGIYNPYTENDEWRDITELNNKAINFLHDRQQLNQLKQRFLRDFQDEVEKQKRFLKKGKLDDFRTAEIVTNTSDRLYKNTERVVDVDTSILFLVDMSGSMRVGKKIVKVKEFCYLLAESCNQIQVPISIIGYQTKPVNNKITVDSSYNRFVPLRLWDVIRFSDSFANIKDRIGYITSKSCKGLTIIGESLEIGAKLLQERPESNKILILLSDGKPTQRHPSMVVVSHFNKVVEDLQNSNINLVGFDFSGNGFMKNYIDDLIRFTNTSKFVEEGYNKFREIILDHSLRE